MSKVQVDTIDTRSGTSTMQIGSTNTSTINIGVSGDTVNIPAGVTIANAGTATGFGGEKNLPYFCANINGNQEVSANAFTTLQFNQESSDSGSCFDTSTYRFTPNVAGRYYISGFIRSGESEDHDNFQLAIYKNGNQTRLSNLRHLHYHTAHIDGLIEMNGSSDYVELKLSHDRSGASTIIGDAIQSQFQGFFVGNT